MPKSTTRTRPRRSAAFAYRARRAATTRFTYGPHPDEHISTIGLCSAILTLGALLLCVGLPAAYALVTVATSAAIFGLCMLAAPWRAVDRLKREQEAWEAKRAAEQRERLQTKYTSDRLREASERNTERQRLLIVGSPRL